MNDPLCVIRRSINLSAGPFLEVQLILTEQEEHVAHAPDSTILLGVASLCEMLPLVGGDHARLFRHSCRVSGGGEWLDLGPGTRPAKRAEPLQLLCCSQEAAQEGLWGPQPA